MTRLGRAAEAVETVGVDTGAAEEWIREHVAPSGPVQPAYERPWSTVLRVPLAAGPAWFKACGPAQEFEPRLTARLFERWPDRVPEVLAYDQGRGWLLLADAGARMGDRGNRPEDWLRILPLYAELQRGEAGFVADHLEHGVPDLRLAALPPLFDDFLCEDLPLASRDRARLEAFAPRFEALCAELGTHGLPETIQHDDLHMNNVFVNDGALRVLDWGDASISHPFASLVPTLRFLEERNGLAADHPQVTRIRDAYLEPWGDGMDGVFAAALQVAHLAHAIAAVRQRRALRGSARERFDRDLAVRLKRSLIRMGG